MERKIAISYFESPAISARDMVFQIGYYVVRAMCQFGPETCIVRDAVQ